MLPKVINILCGRSLTHFASKQGAFSPYDIIRGYEIVQHMILQSYKCCQCFIISLTVILSTCSVRQVSFSKKTLCILILDAS